MYGDGRNPYGAKGGYVRDRDYDYDYDMRGGRRDYGMEDYGYDYGPSYDSRGRRYEIEAYDSSRGRGRDYHRSGPLSDDELEKWAKKLNNEIEEKHKQFFKMDHIITKAEQMGIRFDKFTPHELYVATLMMFTDYKDALNTVNADIYVKLAKLWLCDEDASVKYGDKLKAYYEHIVM